MLNIFDLNRKRDERELKKYIVYNEVLTKCHSRIQFSSEKGQEECVYIVPRFMLGLPTYDPVKCAEFMVDNLRRNGFQVGYTYPNHLYICWKHVPSELTNPYVKKIETDMIVRPYKDYSRSIRQISNLTYETNTPQFQYKALEYHKGNDDSKTRY
jgi:hypothetical protein